MKKSIISLFLMAITLGANAQTSKNVVYDCVVKNMDYTQPSQTPQKKESTSNKVASVAGAVLSALAGEASVTADHPEYADNVMHAITAGIGCARRINLVEGTPSGEVPVLCINTTISAIKTTQRTHVWTDKDKHNHSDIEYSASVTGNITLTDASNGNVVWTYNLNRMGADYGWLSSADAALGNVVSNMQNAITADLNREFPMYASIVESGVAKKDKQKEVYIDLGAKVGVYKGMSFYVYQIMTVAGKEAKKEIGRIKIKEVMGDDISNCKVTKGGQDIKTACDEGKTLLIMSRE